MNKMIKVAVSAIALGASSFVFAQDGEPKNQPDNPWTDCGIGYAIFKNSEIGAAISNVIWDAGTTATTTYVSTPNSCRKRDAEVAQFVGEAFDSLENETAVGQGPHLSALVEVAQCSAETKNALLSSVRSAYKDMAMTSDFASMARNEKAEAYYDIVASQINGKFAADCSVI